MKKVMRTFVLGLTLVSIPGFHAFAADTTLNPIQDAELLQNGASGVVNGFNYGNSQYLTVNWGTTGGPTSTQFPTGGNSYGLFQFDLSSLPSGSVINSAMLTLYSSSYASNPASWPNYLYPVTSNWTESAVTYNTKPTQGAVGIGIHSYNVYPGGLPGYFQYDLTDISQGWLNGTVDNYGLITTDTHYGSGGGRYYARLYSSETTTGYAPRLDINYSVVPEPLSCGLFLLGGTILALKRKRKY